MTNEFIYLVTVVVIGLICAILANVLMEFTKFVVDWIDEHGHHSK